MENTKERPQHFLNRRQQAIKKLVEKDNAILERYNTTKIKLLFLFAGVFLSFSLSLFYFCNFLISNYELLTILILILSLLLSVILFSYINFKLSDVFDINRKINQFFLLFQFFIMGLFIPVVILASAFGIISPEPNKPFAFKSNKN